MLSKGFKDLEVPVSPKHPMKDENLEYCQGIFKALAL
jgi:hypothetical protein